MTVPWELRDGTATVADGDYAAQSGEVSLGYYARSQDILIEVVGDDRVEANETLQLVLLPPTEGEAIVESPGIFTILDDDGTQPVAGSVSMSFVTLEVAEGRSAHTQLVLDGSADIQRAVDIAVRDGTATEFDGDYRPNTSSVRLPAGATSWFFSQLVLDDDIAEPTESFFVDLVNASPGMAVTTGTTEVVIIDDD